MIRFIKARIGAFNWRLAATAFFAIIILHILATFAAPQLVRSTAYSRLASSLPLNQMVVLPPITPDTQPLALMAPDARYAACRFDTSRGPVQLTASLPSPGWTLALYLKDGANFYTAVAESGRRVDVSLLLVSGGEQFPGLSPEARGERSREDATLKVPAKNGIAVLRGPEAGAAYRSRVDNELRRASCSVRLDPQQAAKP